MTVLTIEIPDKETKFVTEFLKKIGGKVKKKNTDCNLDHTPNAGTIKAMEEARAGKVKEFKTAKLAIGHLQKLTNV